ncbi:hypothetical protein TVAGG3_0204850 [Trichomonas vaginalis G3]|uniref:hypothetical protein n=1 Tax=Trichomonas vaginalis (strain ATCC PRA-98 / G3) TaxID=412133 RepID=UPI0021E5B57A|nr:hypothetical protein TVAGG3_0204850 [Trichomonas vaginalis G3]KAI5550864.1 hypothetical protein TVAGG3_0204850 [Trichomonas vaginalis G3]
MQGWVPRGNEQAMANKSKIMSSHLFGSEPEPQYQPRQAPPEPQYSSPPKAPQTFPEYEYIPRPVPEDDEDYAPKQNHTITIFSSEDYPDSIPNLPDFDLPIVEPPTSFDIPVIRTKPNFVATGKRLSPIKRDTFLQMRDELENDTYDRKPLQTNIPQVKKTKKLRTK